jgi:hypothetical protein
MITVDLVLCRDWSNWHKFDIYDIIMLRVSFCSDIWYCNILVYYPGLRDILRVICLSDLGNILAYYLDKTTLLKDEVLLTVGCPIFPPFYIDSQIFVHRKFKKIRSSVESFAERYFFIRILFQVYFDFA